MEELEKRIHINYYAQKQLRKYRKTHKKKCIVCGVTFNSFLEKYRSIEAPMGIHHVNSIRDLITLFHITIDNYKKYLRHIHRKDNLVYACRSCHGSYHYFLKRNKLNSFKFTIFDYKKTQNNRLCQGS